MVDEVVVDQGIRVDDGTERPFCDGGRQKERKRVGWGRQKWSWGQLRRHLGKKEQTGKKDRPGAFRFLHASVRNQFKDTYQQCPAFAKTFN